MKALFSKLLTLWIYLQYPRIPSQQRWFIRFRYLGIIQQLKYFVKDYIIKKPYKIIHFKGEFQQELLHVIPFAYWHYKNGTLLQTRSARFTKELYYFSPIHIDDESLVRDYINNETLEIPNAPHDTKLLKLKWRAVPFSKVYSNSYLTFDKELLIIANRYNTEWGNEPISYFNLDDLRYLFDLLGKRYQIIYNRPKSHMISTDESDILELNDEVWIKTNYPEIIYLPDLIDKIPQANNYNHLQLLVYANCKHFISIHGGTATLASLFGGINFIYSKEGHEHPLNEFQNVFPELSGCDIKVFRDKTLLFSSVKSIA